MNENKGHFCYGCKKYFHDSNPGILTHKDCDGHKYLGICVDSREFNRYDYVNLVNKSKHELIEMIMELR